MPAADPITATLNEPQMHAVNHTDGPLLILAGAGSGKTRALTHRIARLMQDGVPPWQILAVTFTNKAANEMKTRIRNMLYITDPTPFDSPFGLANKQSRLPVMGTFHSVCARILRRDIEHLGRDRSFVIYDADDQEKLVKQTLKEMGIDEKELKSRAVLGAIGRCKSEALGPKEAAAQAATERTRQIACAYVLYQKALRDHNALDFDDLILETVRLFTEVPDILARYQKTWRYINVDEYQDTNHAQYLLISLLARAHRNLCVIGDPDQSIYAFRGADIRNILEFEKEYPGAVRIKLEQNYRSTQPILRAANAIIKPNPNRPEKEMWTERSDGPKPVLSNVADGQCEAREAVRKAELLRTQGMRLNDQVVLYRTNAQSRLFEEACMRAGIPYRIVGGLKFYARKEVKDVLAYLHAILNPDDTVSLLRILNVPSRKIGLTTVGALQAHASAHNLTLWETLREAQKIDLNEGVRNRITAFVALIETYRTKAQREVAAELCGHLLHATGMEQWLRDDSEEGETRWENVQELLSVMRKYDALPPLLSLTSFLEEAALVSEVDKLDEAHDDALTLMTLHLCKGLEFKSVSICGCEEGVFPHGNALFDRAQMEEERRLLYVGMTRAMTHLTIFSARSRMLWGENKANEPSRFLLDLPDDAVERRSDDVLSAFAWAAGRGGASLASERGTGTAEPARIGELHVAFNQDLDAGGDATNQETLAEGTRVMHPAFGTGTIVELRGDIADIRFDSGEKKSFALSIAPLKPV